MNKTPRAVAKRRPFGKDVRRRPTLPHGPPCSTIGAEGLNFRVRNGTGCFPFAIATETLWRCNLRPASRSRPHLKNRTVDAQHSLAAVRDPEESRTRARVEAKPLGLLVPVSSTRCRASTSGLSTQSSGWGPYPLDGGGRPGLEAGFPLRCFQRLSLPNVANQPCPWQDIWHTRGSSVPVLSY